MNICANSAVVSKKKDLKKVITGKKETENKNKKS